MSFHTITVRGRQHEWVLRLHDTNIVEALRADGFVIDEVFYTIPQWVPALMVGPWCRMQDAAGWLRRALWL